ncbi:alpha/beta hydrolase [Roseococcus microcysteis]|uniref:alpha/beta hydrolase n=1 Tax=Roseococcus microcysteis TaxID=2771361 RepID=UPI00168B40D1|nr:alpha/beta hydrolase [Roseococcus microcysteis]
MRRRALLLGGAALSLPGAAPVPPVHLHRPAGWRPGGRVVVVVHGVGRNADGYRDAWAPHAEAHGFLLLCPEFSQSEFPGARQFSQGNARAPRAEWRFGALEAAVDAALAAEGDTPGRDFALYGHSAGAQFVHRHLLLTGAARARRVVIANAGWYSFPDTGTPFPHGLGGVPLDPASLRAALGRDVVILLGEADTDPHHPSLRRDAMTDRQGLNRLERGRNFYAAAQALAASEGVPFGWRLITVPGVAHVNARMAVAAAPLLA